MLIKDVMTTCPHIVGASQTVILAKKRMNENDGNTLNVSDVCTLDSIVFTPDVTLQKVSTQMAETGQGCALIIENDQLLGVSTTTDVCRVRSNTL